MLSKELFCKLLNWAIEKVDRDKKFENALQEYAEDKDFTGFFTQDSSFIIEWLEKAMGDKDDWISWWVYETECGTVSEDLCTATEDGKKWVLRTVENLYDFLFAIYPISGIQRQLLMSAQSAGVRFALQELSQARSDCSVEGLAELIRILLNKVNIDYMAVTGLESQMNMETYEVEQPTLFGRKDV